MKKLILFAAVAVALASCQKGPDEPVIPTPDPGATYLLEGTVSTEGFAWTSQSVIGLYSMTEGVKAVNLECKIDGWEDPSAEKGEGEPAAAPSRASEYDGMATGRFNTPAMDLVKGENTFMVYYPYNAELAYIQGKIYGLEVSTEQTQAAPNIAGECFALGQAKGTPKVDEVFSFTMNPITALVRFTISSKEFAAYSPKKITVWNTADIPVSGGFNIDVANNVFDPLQSATRATVTVTKTKTLTELATQNIYMNVLPADFTGKEMWVLVELQSDKGGTVTLPIRKNDMKFVAGQTTTIDINNLSKTDNAAAEWYEPVENRMLAGLGYAYGDANTYFIQCKSGQTYNGATYAASSKYPDEVKIDIKARGSFFNVVDPRGATFEWFKLGARNDGPNGAGATYTGRTTGYEASGVDPTQFTVNYDGATTVTVKNTGAFAGAPVLLMIKDNKVLWSWTFWNIAADGTEVSEIAVGSYKLANMEIGQPTTQYATWAANKKGSNPDPVFRFTNQYQWGRPMPTFWTSYWSVDDGVAASGAVPVIYGQQSLAESIAHPVGIIIAKDLNTDQPQWQTENVGDLWGNCHKDADHQGVKSIYDPCPKGWRVPDRAVFQYINDNSAVTFENTAGYAGMYMTAANGALFTTNGYVNGKTATNGRMATMGGGETANAAGAKWAILWSNYVGGSSASQPNTLYYGSSASTQLTPALKTFNRSISAPVRCQVDEENR